MRDCSTCNCRKFCKQAYRIRPTRDAEGRIYDGTTIGFWLYDYVARAFNHATKKYEVFRGRIRVKSDTRFTVAISASIRGQSSDAWFCTEAKELVTATEE